MTPWCNLVFFRIRLPKRKWRGCYVLCLPFGGEWMHVFIEEIGRMSNIRSNITVPNANVRPKAL
jgi:hypothetical protein